MRMYKGTRILSQLLLCLLFSVGATAQAVEPAPQWLSNEIYCLARVIYAEARGLPEQAQYDVAYSVMNRMELNRRDFGGKSACGVAFHPEQYSGVRGVLGDPWKPGNENVWFVSLMRAWRVYTRREVPDREMRKALYYLNPQVASEAGKGWFKAKLRPIGWSSSHLFYTE